MRQKKRSNLRKRIGYHEDSPYRMLQGIKLTHHDQQQVNDYSEYLHKLVTGEIEMPHPTVSVDEHGRETWNYKLDISL